MNIRPFDESDRDYRAMAAIKWILWPEYQRTIDEFRGFDAAWDRDFFRRRLVAEVDAQVVGVAQGYRSPWSEDPDTFGFWIDVHPAWQRRGIGGALYAATLEVLAPHRPRTLLTEVREDHRGAVEFLERRAFQTVGRSPESWLEVQTFDPARFDRALERVRAAGVDICCLPALQARDPDWARKWWALNGLLLQDVPADASLTNLSFETFAEMMALPEFLPAGCFFALAGDVYVGLTTLSALPGDPTLLNTGLTGVIRSHRRRGIATALKVHSVEFARRHGAARILTRNEERNPMYEINTRLGFRPGLRILDYKKSLSQP